MATIQVIQSNAEATNAIKLSNASPISGIYLSYKDLDAETKTIYISKFDNYVVNTNSSLTSYPTVSGDIYADHIIKQPITISFSGTFEEGKSDNLFTSDIKSLKDIQSLFEYIKDEALLITIMRYTKSSTNEIRFIKRENMVIDSLRWVEDVNCLDFTISMSEVMLADVIEVETVDTADELLPNTKTLSTTSFTSSLIDEDLIYQTLLKKLVELNMVDGGIVGYIASKRADEIHNALLESTAKGAIAGVVAGIWTVTGVVAMCGASIPVWGWIAVAAVAILAAAATCILTFADSISKISERYANENKYMFEAITFKEGDDEHNIAQVNRLSCLFSNVVEMVQKLNSYILAYEIAYNERQKSLITIDGVGYEFRFHPRGSKENGDYAWSCDIYDVTSQSTEKKVAMCPRFSASYTNRDVFSLMPYFQTANGHYVYIASKVSDDATDEQKWDLRNYFIIDSTINFTNFQDIFLELIDAGMRGGTI